MDNIYNSIVNGSVSPCEAPKLYLLSTGVSYVAKSHKDFLEQLKAEFENTVNHEVSMDSFMEDFSEAVMRNWNIHVCGSRGANRLVEDLRKKKLIAKISPVN